MPLIKIRQEEAVQKLAAGPLGIGEGHDNPRARQFLVNLLERKLVKMLFLEVPADQGRVYDQCLAKAFMGRQGGLPLEEIHDFLRPIDGFLQSPREISFSQLIIDAMRNGARIVFSDKFYVRSRLASTPPAMKARNECVDAIFSEASSLSGGVEGAGCVILFGAEHFESKDDLLTRMIGEDISQTVHWVDLSE